MGKSVGLIKFILLTAVITTLLVSGCESANHPGDEELAQQTSSKEGESAETPADELRRYAPTKPGAKWRLRITFGPGKKETPLTAIVENLAPTKLNGATVHKQKVTYLGRPDLDVTKFWTLDNSAAKIVGDQYRAWRKAPYPSDKVQIFLKEPLKVGTRWSTTNRGIDNRPVPSEVEIVAVNESVTVPTGTYPGALKVKQVDTLDLGASMKGISESYSWYVPNIGMVKTDATFKWKGRPATTMLILLEEYTPSARRSE